MVFALPAGWRLATCPGASLEPRPSTQPWKSFSDFFHGCNQQFFFHGCEKNCASNFFHGYEKKLCGRPGFEATQEHYNNVPGNEARVEAWNEARVEAWNEARVETWNEARVEAWNEARVEAWNEARVEAWNEARVEAWNEAGRPVILCSVLIFFFLFPYRLE